MELRCPNKCKYDKKHASVGTNRKALISLYKYYNSW